MRGGITVAALLFAFFAYVYLTLPDVRALRTANPRTTAFMELREREAAQQGRQLRHYQVWVPYTRISQTLKRAVLVAEDDAFWQHEGIDMEQLKISIKNDIEKGKAIRGGSTITQQLAKNLYLSPSRDPVRKLRELIIARRLEAELSKARIFEIYLNVIEWGDGIWGAEAAARSYFGTSAATLSPAQAAMLAGAIINPRTYSPAHPNTRLLRRQRIILARMGAYQPPATVPVVNNGPQPSDVNQEEETTPSEEYSAPADTEPAAVEPIEPKEPAAPTEPSDLPPPNAPAQP
ncbi:MAG TPA: monofunctional biosynthetic peptidoglycan transglycosylase [Vicinamibacterales bacterium]|nr:monofunctional biosynthetic peptidoglycan transglycosylase [Vicinamibacterales bacterium]